MEIKKNLFGKFITCWKKGKKFRTIGTEKNIVSVLVVPDQNVRNIPFQFQTFAKFYFGDSGIIPGILRKKHNQEQLLVVDINIRLSFNSHQRCSNKVKRHRKINMLVKLRENSLKILGKRRS